jgi:hypothetical protein
MEFYGDTKLDKLPTTDNEPLSERFQLLHRIIDIATKSKSVEDLKNTLLSMTENGDELEIPILTDFQFFSGKTAPKDAPPLIFQCKDGWFSIKLRGKDI